MIWKDADGIRHLPDGRRAELVIETAEVDPAETDALEIIAAQWKTIGIAAVARAQPRQAARQRVGAGVTVLSLFYGLANGPATADSPPAALAPDSAPQKHCTRWGPHHERTEEGRVGNE